MYYGAIMYYLKCYNLKHERYQKKKFFDMMVKGSVKGYI